MQRTRQSFKHRFLIFLLLIPMATAQNGSADPGPTPPSGPGSSQTAIAKTLLAMELAIEHFNQDHSRDITPETQQFRYMMSLIDQMPGLLDHALSLPPTDSFISPYQSIILYNLYEEDERFPEFRKLVAGCERRIEPAMEVFDLLDPRSSHPLVGLLRDLGFATAMLEPTSQSYRLAWLNLAEGSYRDMDYVLDLARSLGSDAQTLLRHARSYDDYDKLIGASKGAYILGSTGTHLVSDPVTIRFWSGWGDCPSGCINKDFADYTATPTYIDEEGVRFTISEPVLSSIREEESEKLDGGPSTTETPIETPIEHSALNDYPVDDQGINSDSLE